MSAGTSDAKQGTASPSATRQSSSSPGRSAAHTSEAEETGRAGISLVSPVVGSGGVKRLASQVGLSSVLPNAPPQQSNQTLFARDQQHTASCL